MTQKNSLSIFVLLLVFPLVATSQIQRLNSQAGYGGTVQAVEGGKEGGNAKGDLQSPDFAKGPLCGEDWVKADLYSKLVIPRVFDVLEVIRQADFYVYWKLMTEFARTEVCQTSSMSNVELSTGRGDQPAIIHILGVPGAPSAYYFLPNGAPISAEAAQQYNQALSDLAKDNPVEAARKMAILFPALQINRDRGRRTNRLHLDETLMFGLKYGEVVGPGYSENHQAGVLVYELFHPAFGFEAYSRLDIQSIMNSVDAEDVPAVRQQFIEQGLIADPSVAVTELCQLDQVDCEKYLNRLDSKSLVRALITPKGKASQALRWIGQNGLGSFQPEQLEGLKNATEGLSVEVMDCSPLAFTGGKGWGLDQLNSCIRHFEKIGLNVSPSKWGPLDFSRYLFSLRWEGVDLSIETLRVHLPVLLDLIEPADGATWTSFAREHIEQINDDQVQKSDLLKKSLQLLIISKSHQIRSGVLSRGLRLVQ